MIYPGVFLTSKCSNTKVVIFNDSPNHISWYAPHFSHVFLESCQNVWSVDFFLEVPPEKVVGWVEILRVGWSRKVCAS